MRRRTIVTDGGTGNLLRAAGAEAIGTFMLVLIGTAVATAAILNRETAGQAYDSLAIASRSAWS